MKKPFLFGVLFCLTCSVLTAQSAKWEFGLSLNALNYLGDLVDTRTPSTKTNELGYGLFLRRNVSETFSMRLNGLYGTISGNDRNSAAPFDVRGFSFNSTLAEIGVLAEYDLFGHRRYEKGHLKKTISPYVFGGIAGFMIDPTTDYNESGAPIEPGLASRIAKDKSYDIPSLSLAIPFGGGVRFDLSQKVSVALEVGLRTTFSDYLDGVSQSGNPDQNDWYMSGGLNLSYRFGRFKDADGDRVFDRYDACPNMPGEITLGGCPDTDGDGVIDEKDKCPYQRGSAGMDGCPDRDGDGVTDREDICPDAHGPKALKGCPDKDADGIPDLEDSCPDISGVLSAKGCPDADLDSIPNMLDKCPTEAGPVANNGCPDKDTDGDGLVDRLDLCPDKAGLRVLNGCPDADGDGIVDSKDRCPTAAGAAANNGCPEIKKEEKEVLNMAMRGVQFDPSKATLKKTSYPVLDQVVDILKKYPNYTLSINGHTDSDGDDKKNMTLSENRAKTCRDYFVSKGVDTKRLTFKGFGETQPLGPNTTKEKKALNRRVEFDLKLPE